MVDQSEMHFDAVAMGRTPEMQRRLERAVKSSEGSLAVWLNKCVIAAVEGDEDVMDVDSRGMVRGHNGKWFPNPKTQHEKPQSFVVSRELIARALRMAEFWEIDPNEALGALALLEERVARPNEAEDTVDDLCGADTAWANRIRKKLADVWRSQRHDFGKMPAVEAGQMTEVWARVIQFGRLPWDDGCGWGDRAAAIEAYMTAPTHQP